MAIPCVRVRPAAGERTRRLLADADLIADSYEIAVEDDWLYIPITDPSAVPQDVTVVDHEVPERDVQTTPADLLSFDPAYERLGDVALLDESDPERAREIAQAIIDSDLPITRVLNKASKIKGPQRIRDWNVLVDESSSEADAAELSAETLPDDTSPDETTGGIESADDRFVDDSSARRIETVHREYGCEFALDIAAVYFSPRLATERHRVAKQVESGERAFDMFAGVGPFVIPFATRGATCVGVDVNDRAIEYLRENASRNGVADRVTAICADVREVAPEYAGWADRIVMNLPHSAEKFLDSAVCIAGESCVIHYYDIQHEDDPFGPGERAIRDATHPEYDVSVETRRIVRSYAPHELNVCLDVRLEQV